MLRVLRSIEFNFLQYKNHQMLRCAIKSLIISKRLHIAQNQRSNLHLQSDADFEERASSWLLQNQNLNQREMDLK
jgi:hypothetical protein